MQGRIFLPDELGNLLSGEPLGEQKGLGGAGAVALETATLKTYILTFNRPADLAMGVSLSPFARLPCQEVQEGEPQFRPDSSSIPFGQDRREGQGEAPSCLHPTLQKCDPKAGHCFHLTPRPQLKAGLHQGDCLLQPRRSVRKEKKARPWRDRPFPASRAWSLPGLPRRQL